MPDLPSILPRLHSSYLRSPADLAVSGQTVRLKLRVRRFRCQNQQCKQQTTARTVPGTLGAHAQRTHRLTALFTLFALALSGRAGERLLVQAGMPTSADTLLRLVKQAATPPISTLSASWVSMILPCVVARPTVISTSILEYLQC